MTAEQDLVHLAHELGDPSRQWAILAEGNCSVRLPNGDMRVKASGAQMGSAGRGDFVTIPIAAILDLIVDPQASDADVRSLFDQVAAERGGRRPSVESLLHAVCLDQPGVQYAGHTHPVPINAILCSRHPTLLSDGALFPDQIVVLGPDPLYVPYVDPGLMLAREVRHLLTTRAAPPRVIFLGNHGLFALGASSLDVVNITAMAVKVAEIVVGSSGLGGPAYLNESDVARIDGRPDEEFRRAALSVRSPMIVEPVEGGTRDVRLAHS